MYKQIFLCGAVTGLPIENVREKFNKAEMEVRKMGFLTVNPVELILEFNEFDEEGLSSWQEEMDFLRPFFDRCHGVYMITDWQKSKGAKVEYQLAQDQGKVVMFQPRHISVESLIRATEEATGMSWDQIIAPSRIRNLVEARRAFTYLAWRHKSGTLVSLGKMMKQDHTTLVHAKNTAIALLDQGDPIFTEYIDSIKEKLAI